MPSFLNSFVTHWWRKRGAPGWMLDVREHRSMPGLTLTAAYGLGHDVLVLACHMIEPGSGMHTEIQVRRCAVVLDNFIRHLNLARKRRELTQPGPDPDR